MAPRGSQFTTSLSIEGCASTFKEAASAPMFKNPLLRFGEKMQRTSGAMRTGIFRPEPDPTQVADLPGLSLGWRFENKYGGNLVQMDVWDRGDHREVQIFEAARSKSISRFLDAFRATGSTDLS